MSLSQVNQDGTVIYSVYPLMNNHCYCNTVYTIKPDTKVMEVRAQRSIKTGEEISTRYAETLLTSLEAAVEFHLGVMIQISELSFRGAVYGLPKGHCRSH